MGHRHGPPDSFGAPAFHPDAAAAAAAALPSLPGAHALFSFSSRRPLDMLSSTPAAPTALRGAIAACQTAQSLRRRLASRTRLKTFQKACDDITPASSCYDCESRYLRFTAVRFVVIKFNNYVHRLATDASESSLGGAREQNRHRGFRVQNVIFTVTSGGHCDCNSGIMSPLGCLSDNLQLPVSCEHCSVTTITPSNQRRFQTNRIMIGEASRWSSNCNTWTVHAGRGPGV